MYHPDQVRLGESDESGQLRGHRACLVAGCPCKDPRIVSHRRAAFFAAVARRAGETANRMITPEPGWTLPAPSYA
jgi:hypothetical protein